MGAYDQQIQAPAQNYDADVRNIENSGGDGSPVVAESDSYDYEWADVIKDLEPYY